MQIVKLAECVLEIDDVAAGRGIVLIAVFEIRPVDISSVQRIGAERGAARFEGGLRADIVTPGAEVV